ncbi:50S ribosomal protein L31, chloroplastic [Tanacetum coccineum]
MDKSENRNGMSEEKQSQSRKTFEENDANEKPILNTDIGGSSYDVSGNVIVKRRCIQQPEFRQETLGQIGSIEHQQRSTREVDSDPGNSISMPQISDTVHNPRLTDPTLQAVVSIGKRYRQVIIAVVIKFDIRAYEQMEKPVIIVVVACCVTRYNGLQLSRTFATHYYLNLNIPETYQIREVGEHVFTTDGTKKEYVVDVCSGNHPFYLRSRSGNLINADRVEEFRKKFDGVGSLDQFMHIPTLKGEIVIPLRRKPAGKGRK